MYDVVPIAVVLLALAGMIIVIGRKIPALAELPDTPPSQRFWRAALVRIRRLAGRLPYQRYWGFVLRVWEKILRRMRIFVLKTENKSAAWLAGVKNRSRQVAQKSKFLRGEGIALRVDDASAPAAPDDALGQLLAAVRRNPEDVPAYLALSDFYLERGQPQEAKVALEKLLAIDPAHSIARQKLERLGGGDDSGQQAPHTPT
ncbi:tetratricopeptide repeat protein [Candidatus Parcubacteria bacterium]|nr:tetratricopeptide repeat protein [Candidatus Parcubacteria bacterium]MBI4385281.1 tetratricopeptide repeat protein [Candidatus Parcubacteria bacterium]